MIDPATVSFNFIKKEPFIGSMNGMRYKLWKSDDDTMGGCIWQEPSCFEKTEEVLKTYETFPMTKDGCAEAVAWLNEQLVKRAEIWNAVKDKPLCTIM